MTLGARHILTVTTGGILYRDEADQIGWIDFKVCNRNWCLSREFVTEEDAWHVGWRNTSDGRVLDVEFFSQPRIRFEFISYVQRDGELLDPMYHRGGWTTWDAAT